MRACTLRRLRLATTLAFMLALAACAQPAQAQAQAQLTPFGGQAYAQPFYVAGDPSDPNRVFVVEAAGRIRLVEGGITQPTPFLDISGDVWDLNEGGCECGLFSVAFPPDHDGTGRFYVFFTRDVPGASPGVVPFHDLVIREYQRSAGDPDDADEASGRDVLVIGHRDFSNHNGGQLQFGPDGHLYIATGDGGGGDDPGNNAQNIDSLLGKLLRIDPTTQGANYASPADNPFAGATPGADEIYSYGLRNPYRFSFDRLKGDLIIGDVGQAAWEEIDFTSLAGARGANFGWDCFEGTAPGGSNGQAQCNPLRGSHTPPVHQYENPPSGPAAISGGYVVRDMTVPSLFGRYVYADTYAALGGNIYAAGLTPTGASGDGPTGLTASAVVSFGEDACGRVYVAVLGGTVSRIEPSGGSPGCQPRTALAAATVGDQDPPDLELDIRKARRAAKRGKLIVRIGCDEACVVTGEAEVRVPGKDLSADSDANSLPAGRVGKLELDLSARQTSRLRALLRRGRKARAELDLVATDAAGNETSADRRVKQKR